jgi:hypothetical protein
MALFIALDVIPRAFYRAGWPPRSALSLVRDVFRERWSLRRLLIVAGALLGFYLTYVGYRNLKSFLPFARDANFDNFLLDLDRNMAFGHNPGVVLHDLLGTGFSAQILSLVYVTFLFFVPLSLGVAVVWQRRLHGGLWYVTSMNIGWLLGAASYYVLPALGPAYSAPQYFMTLPETGVSKLQESLLVHRFDVISAPHATSGVQSIAAFASLHVALVLNAALIAHFLQVRRALRVGLWVFLALTMLATVYFGWHYIIDLVAGAGIGAVAVALGAKLSGHPIRPSGRVRVLAGGAHSTASAT